MARKARLLRRIAAPLAGTLIVAGCYGGKEFRDAAGPALRTGLDSIATGLIDGAYAVFEPDSDSNSNSSRP
ncbi:MAG TPA: hypothetical protein VGM03_10590 [Phycisphaerae bacterium]|jgi:hypothetical protein